MLRLPKSLRTELKKPLGELHKSIDLIENPLQEQLSNDKLIIGIGDVTTRKLVDLELQPQICIVDNLVERHPVQNTLDHTDNIKYVDNPAGTLTDELIELLIDSINTATSEEPVIIVVDGEEDLAVLPCILNAPKDTLILYGQPKEGVVLVKTGEAFDKAENYYKQLIKE
ncbi:GTP-dependent dephospho-CoA kinase family protein [Methanosphaera sp.]